MIVINIYALYYRVNERKQLEQQEKTQQDTCNRSREEMQHFVKYSGIQSFNTISWHWHSMQSAILAVLVTMVILNSHMYKNNF